MSFMPMISSCKCLTTNVELLLPFLVYTDISCIVWIMTFWWCGRYGFPSSFHELTASVLHSWSFLYSLKVICHGLGECLYFSIESVVPPLGGATAFLHAVHTKPLSSCSATALVHSTHLPASLPQHLDTLDHHCLDSPPLILTTYPSTPLFHLQQWPWIYPSCLSTPLPPRH